MPSSISTLPVFILAGPTAVGKTNIALELATKYNFEIISADSAQVYIGMNIGTAKPDVQILNQIQHHLINLITPEESYSVGRFIQDTSIAINKIHKSNKIPLIVGGTMLYINALLFGIHNLPPANQSIRRKIEESAKINGWEYLYQQLLNIDDKTAKNIHPSDKQRISRALEIFHSFKITPSQYYAQTKKNQKFNYKNIWITANNRTQLRANITTRWLKMIEDGIIDELKYLKNQYRLNPNLPSMRTIGYRQIWQYLAARNNNNQPGLLDLYNQKAINATSQFAKRQMTWLKSIIAKSSENNLFPQLILDYQESDNLLKNKISKFIDYHLNN